MTYHPEGVAAGILKAGMTKATIGVKILLTAVFLRNRCILNQRITC